MSWLHRLLILLGMTALLAACTSTPIEPVAQQPTPSTAPTATTPAATATSTPTPSATAVPPSPTITPNPTAAPLTAERGLARGAAPQRLIAVMLDNHPAAYPQSGMDTAVMVFEALAEYGVTRYMAVFAPGISPAAEEIGAVRSARDYFVEWAMGLGAVYVHAGGSPDGLALAESATEIANLDGLYDSGSAYFYRSSERPAPHNLYTSSAELERYVADQDANAVDPDGHGFIFKPDMAAEQRPASQRISYYFIYADDPAGWLYDPATNGYLRLRRGEPHVDRHSGEQLWFKNVVVMEVPEAPIPGDDQGRIRQEVIGEGRARLFADGIEREVRWRKSAAASPLRFYDPTGNETELNAGPVWIAAIPTLDNLSVDSGS